MTRIRERLDALRARGCNCGIADGPHTCPVHPDPGDNRGLRAWFEAGMPLGFPMERVTCSRCHSLVNQGWETLLEYVESVWTTGRYDLTADELVAVELYRAAIAELDRADALMYPDPRLDDRTQPFEHRPTTICPRCSVPAAEARLRREAEEAGYELKPISVFGIHAIAA